MTFVVDSKGNALDAQVKGNNEDVNAFIEAAFYRIKDKGKWKPAEDKETGILYGICSFDAYLQK
jgi:hypothetical protein